MNSPETIDTLRTRLQIVEIELLKLEPLVDLVMHKNRPVWLRQQAVLEEERTRILAAIYVKLCEAVGAHNEKRP